MPARRRASIMGCGNVLSGYESVRQERLAECREMVQEKFALSQLPDLRSTAPAFQTQEVDFGEVLGRGKFGTVSEVRAFLVPGVSPENLYNSSRQLQVTIDDDHAHEEKMNPREFLAKHCVRADGHGRYAIKTMSSSVISDIDAFIQGVQNMAIESRILAGLDHPNIMKLRGVASVEPFNEYFFFVMDRLYTSFERQIEEWEQRTKVKGGLKLSLFGSKSKAESITKEIYKEKIVSMFHLADALAYMHTQNVIYRNLKVQNVGLDIRGDVRLFDFGYAREVFESTKCEDGTYRLTQLDLSGPLLPGHLAPEIANGSTYNERVDSYSFALLLWQTMSGESPFSSYDLQSLQQNVWNGSFERPLVNDKWPLCIKILLKRSWEHNLQRRNPMKAIADILRKEALSLLNGDDSQLMHTKRKSTFVLRRTNSESLLSKTGSLTHSETSDEEVPVVFRKLSRPKGSDNGTTQQKKRFQHRRYSLGAARNLADDEPDPNLNDSCDLSVISYPPVSYSADVPQLPTSIDMSDDSEEKSTKRERKRSSSRKPYRSSSRRSLKDSEDDDLSSSHHGSQRSRSASRKSLRSSSKKRTSESNTDASDAESSHRKNGLSRRGRSSSRRDIKRSSSRRSLKSSKVGDSDDCEKEKDGERRSTSRKPTSRSSSRKSLKRSSSRKSLTDEKCDKSLDDNSHSAKSDLELETAGEGEKPKRSSSKRSLKRSSSKKSLKRDKSDRSLDSSSHSASIDLGLDSSADGERSKLKRSSSRRSLRRNKDADIKQGETESSDEKRKLKRSSSRKSLNRSKSTSDDSDAGSIGSNKSMGSDRSIKSSGSNKTTNSSKSGSTRPGLGRKSLSNKSLNDMLEGGNWSSSPTETRPSTAGLNRQGSRRHLNKTKPKDLAPSKINSEHFGDWTESAAVDDPAKIVEVPTDALGDL